MSFRVFPWLQMSFRQLLERLGRDAWNNGRLYAGIKRLPGVREGRSRFGSGVAFFRGRREFTHFHGRSEIDIRLTADGVARHRRLLSKVPGWCPNPYSPDWIIVRVAGCDLGRTLKLVASAHAHAAMEKSQAKRRLG